MATTHSKKGKSTTAVRWQKLSEQHQIARDEYFRAFGVMNRKFLRIGSGTSRDNPTDAEVSAVDAAWKKWENIKRRMKAFAKKHA